MAGHLSQSGWTDYQIITSSSLPCDLVLEVSSIWMPSARNAKWFLQHKSMHRIYNGLKLLVFKLDILHYAYISWVSSNYNQFGNSFKIFALKLLASSPARYALFPSAQRVEPQFTLVKSVVMKDLRQIEVPVWSFFGKIRLQPIASRAL